MLESDLYKLFLSVLKFRKAIEKTDKSLLPISFQKFPKGSSRDTSWILAKYLQENGFGEFEYVIGNRGLHSHTWLQQDNLIIDVTADQFEDQKNKAIVVPNFEWHKMFNGKVQQIATMDHFDQNTQTTLLNAYKVILENIK